MPDLHLVPHHAVVVVQYYLGTVLNFILGWYCLILGIGNASRDLQIQ